MHRERLTALSRAVASSHTGKGLRQALALTLLALERSTSGGVPALALKVEGARRLGEVEPRPQTSPLEHFESLLDLPQAEFQARYTAAVALTLRDELTQNKDADALLQALGRRNNLNEAYYTLEASYLSPMTKDALLDFALTLPLEVKIKRSDSKPALIAGILAHAPALRAMNWMPEGFAPLPRDESTPGGAQGVVAPVPEAPEPPEVITEVQPFIAPSAAISPVSAAPSVLPSIPWKRDTVLPPIRPTQEDALTPPTPTQLSSGWPAVSSSSLPSLGFQAEGALGSDPEDDADTWFSNNPLPCGLAMSENTHRASP